MKILIVNATDLKGGAARAAYRLHKGLISQGIDSTMLVQNKSSDDYTVKVAPGKVSALVSKFRPFIEGLLTNSSRLKGAFSSARIPSGKLINFINELNPDIVHLHWINDGMIRIEDLKNINAKLVWSLHDMWGFTGGCHYSKSCVLYREKCGNCHFLKDKSEKDQSRSVYNRKLKTYSQLPNLSIIGLSKWMEKEARTSKLFSGCNITNLPNPINVSTYKKLDKQYCRKVLNLPADKQLVLFGAMGATSDERKGFNELFKSLDHVNADDIELIVFGASEPEVSQSFPFPVRYMGLLNDDWTMAVLYSAVDVMVVPSLQENLSNTIVESLMCCTPVVGFDIGGNSDMIEHLDNGYLAKELDINDLANGISWVLNNGDDLILPSNNKAIDKFSEETVVPKYIKHYRELIQRED
ncbi:glycosyltransferase family 4 protein [Vibrio artabrorum]|uniref:glycosyltransferase family 4 protein n=1 Tax=Vibrio artabrorum TaxID=446374 RepID=UPI00354D19B0